MRSLNPIFKFVGLLVPTFFLAAWHDTALNCAAFVLSVAALLLSRVRGKTICILLLPVLLAAVGMFFTGYRFSADAGMPVNAENLHLGASALQNGLRLASRVPAYAGLGLLFALTTEPVPLVQAARRQLRLPAVFAYGLLAAWGILPHMLTEYRRTRAAFRARGMRAFPVSPAVLRPLLVKSVRWSEELSIAMESKGFSGKAVRTEFQPAPVRGRDWVFCTVCCVVLPVVGFVYLQF